MLLLLIACTALIIIVITKLKTNKTSGKAYGYFKNENLQSEEKKENPK